MARRGGIGGGIGGGAGGALGGALGRIEETSRFISESSCPACPTISPILVSGNFISPMSKAPRAEDKPAVEPTAGRSKPGRTAVA
jgi:hypothetical protein